MQNDGNRLNLLNDRKSQLAFISLAIMWGFTWIMGKYQVNNGILPELAVVYRFIGTCFITFCIIKFKKISLKIAKKDIKILFIFAFFCVSFNFIFFYYAAYYMITSISAIIYSFLIILSAVIKHFFKLTPEKLSPIFISAFIGILGLACIMFQKFYTQKIELNLIIGIVFAFLGTLFYSIGSVFYEDKKPQLKAHPLTLFFYAAIFGCFIIMLEIVFRTQITGEPLNLIPHFSFSFLFSYFYLAISGFGVFLMMILIQRIGAIQTSYVNFITPIIAIFVSAIFEDYNIGISTIIGIILIIISNYIAIFRKKLDPEIFPKLQS